MKLVFTLLIFFLLTGGTTLGAVVRHTFETYYITASPDGVITFHILGINGKFPGPTIEATVGDIIEVTLINKIQDEQNVTLHWHGMEQRGTLFEDGTSQIAQCPLPYGSFQVYRFQVTQSGTYWYHSHVNSQYTEGLIGALIVHNHREHYTFDGEITLILTDWYHRSAHENEAWYLSPQSGGLVPYPDSSLINGFGRYPCNLAVLQNRSCSMIHQHRQVFNVQQNAIYRVRIINAAAIAFFDFSIDGHILDTMEVDGIEVAEPVSVNIATIAPGQRYSFLIQPQSKNPGTLEEDHRFLIRSAVRKDLLRDRNDDFENINKFPQGLLNEVTAVLQPVDRDFANFPHRVEESSEQFSYEKILPPPLHRKPNKRDTMNSRNSKLIQEEISDEDDVEIVFLDQMKLIPLDRIPAPDHFDEQYIISGGSVKGEDGISRFAFNGTPFHLPHEKPLLFSLVEDGKLPEEAFPLEVKNGSVVQLVLNSRGNHPFHLHGHHFWVVGIGKSGDGNYDPSRHELNMNAMKRDTIVPQSWAVIRFVADNPGIWTLHCHIDWHNLSGMALTIVEAADIVRESFKPTVEAKRICRLHR